VPSADVAAAVADAHRHEWAFVLAATVRVTRDIDLAEECVQEAYAQALTAWTREGVPARPGAWLTTVARNRALDLVRRNAVQRRALPLLLIDERADDIAERVAVAADPHILDDRLRLICTCCHPTLAPEAQVALTLRLVCGLSTAEVARAFLVSESTMAARLTRAKKKIAAARIPYRVPAPAELPERVAAVLTVVHLLYTTGHTCPYGAELARRELTERAIDIARMLRVLLPGQAEVCGLLALMLLTESRRDSRLDADGAMVPLESQDRARWNRELSRRVWLSCASRCATPESTRCRPPSPRSMPRPPTTTPPTGGRSSASTTNWPASGRPRWSPSTAPWPSATPTVPRPAWPRSTSSPHIPS
jgi:RNA polymerase sigma-70 factor (ECF subfamily)